MANTKRSLGKINRYIELVEAKICSCGERYPRVPPHAIETLYGYWFNCHCHSTILVKRTLLAHHERPLDLHYKDELGSCFNIFLFIRDENTGHFIIKKEIDPAGVISEKAKLLSVHLRENESIIGAVAGELKNFGIDESRVDSLKTLANIRYRDTRSSCDCTAVVIKAFMDYKEDLKKDHPLEKTSLIHIEELPLVDKEGVDDDVFRQMMDIITNYYKENSF